MTIKDSLRIDITEGELWRDGVRVVQITGIVHGERCVRYRRLIGGELKGDETKAGIGYFLSRHVPE